MLPAATLPAARYYVTPARGRRACGRGLAGPRREARRGKEPARDAAAGLAEVLAMPAIWKDAAGDLLELPGPGGGIVACGALPGAAAPVPAWLPGELAAAGVAAEPGPVREGTGLGLVTSVAGPALIGEALAGAPGPAGAEDHAAAHDGAVAGPGAGAGDRGGGAAGAGAAAAGG